MTATERTWIIVAPRYSQGSNGILGLHKFCASLNKSGRRARLAFIASNDPSCQKVGPRGRDWTNPAWDTPPALNSELWDPGDAIVVYPEVILGNPIAKARNIVRWFLNKEGACNGGQVQIGPRDFVLAHSRVTRPDAMATLFHVEVAPCFNREGTRPIHERTLDLTYWGKGVLYGQVAHVDKAVTISRDFPANQQQLAYLLRECRFFNTFDAWTQTNLEAVMCGAVPVVHSYGPWTPEEVDGSELGRIPRLDASALTMDTAQFLAERDLLEARVRELSASWQERVEATAKQIEEHFS